MRQAGVDPEDNDPGIQAVVSQCQSCERQNRKNPVVCEAFPDGIPMAILLGAYDHRNPYMENGEVADQGLRFEPRETP